MIQTINEGDFLNAFRQSDERKDQFSYYGLKALYEYLTEYEDATEHPMELDIVAICCEFTEYESATECIKDLGLDYNYDSDEDLTEAENSDEFIKGAREYLENLTTVIDHQDGIIINSNF